MDYKTFQEKIGLEMDTPTDEQVQKLIEGDNTIHVQVVIGHELSTGEQVALPTVVYGEKFVSILSALEERGAIRGQDYLICAFLTKGRMIAAIHTLSSFICDEDVV